MMGRAIGLAAALLLALAGTASAATGSLVGVRPAADDQSWLVMTVASGQTVRATALVLNLSDDPQTVAIGTADGVTTPEGVFTLAGDAETPRGVGAWIHVSRASATLAPGERLRLPVTIAVPPGTTPGDYSGGITVQAGARERQAADGGLAVRVVERVGLRVYVTVPGVRDGSLAVQKLETTAKDGGGLRGALGLPESLDVHFAVRNTGNVQYPELSGEVRLYEDGDLRSTRPLALGTVLPGDVRPVDVSLPLPEWSPGRYEVAVRVSGRPAARASATEDVSAMRVYALGLLVVVVAGLGAYGLWRRGRRAP